MKAFLVFIKKGKEGNAMIYSSWSDEEKSDFEKLERDVATALTIEGAGFDTRETEHEKDAVSLPSEKDLAVDYEEYKYDEEGDASPPIYYYQVNNVLHSNAAMGRQLQF